MIVVDNISKSFGDVHAAEGVSFEAGDGSITGLLGPNGAGKSTTLRMISTVLTPDQGRVLIDGESTVADPRAARMRLGVLPQAHGLYPRLSARENIRYYGKLNGLDGDVLEAHIDRLAEMLEFGDILERRVKGFSHGQQMKVALARALIHGPRNVVLDEPTNGLDVMATRSLREIIRKLRDEGHCVLFSSHVMQEVAALCDEIVIIAHGHVVLRGTPEEIRAQTGEHDLEEAFVRAIGKGELEAS